MAVLVATRRHALPGFLLLAFAWSAAAAQPEADALYGRPILALSFRGDAAVDEKALAKLTDLGPGQPLTSHAVGTALKNLFATRRFSDLWVEAAPAGEGALVTIAFTAVPRIERIDLTHGLPTRGKIRDALGLNSGDVWTETAGENAKRTIEKLLANQGYFDARVAVLVEAGSSDTSVDVRFDVALGRVYRVGPVEFLGPTDPLAASELVDAMRLVPGTRYREARAREATDRLRAFLAKKGYARAEVRFEGERHDPMSGLAMPRYALFVGPHVVLEVTGESVSFVKKSPDSPWAKGEPPDEDSVRFLTESLRRAYQESGYARAKVSAAFQVKPDEEVVKITIDRGERYAISRVELKGVTALEASEVTGVMATSRRGFLSTGRLVDHDLQMDRESITALYRSRGYEDVRALPPIVKDGPRPFTLEVIFPVEEGRQVLVGRVTVNGVRAIPLATIEKQLGMKAGRPLDPGLVKSDVDRLRSLYAERGFVNARVTERTTTTAEPPVADVVYEIDEDGNVTFGKTVVRGTRRTRTRVVERELSWKEGDPFSLTKVAESNQNLSRLGVFQRVELADEPTDPETRSKTMLVTLTEGKPWSLLYGIGGEYDRLADKPFNLRLSAGVSYQNLFGRALVAGLEGRFSPRESRALFTLRDRSLFDLKIPTSFSVFLAEQFRPTYQVRRRGVFLDLEKRLSNTLKTAFRYQYEIVVPKADDAAVLSSLERQNQQNAISSIGLSLTYDGREPDPFDPRRGFFVAADVKYAFPFVDANARFLKGFVQATMYRPYQKTTFAVGLRLGLIQSLAACDPVAHPGCPPNLEIPIVERFYAGGRTTQRAFALDALGIIPQTLTVDSNGNYQGVGGNGLLLANAEWRIPVYGNLGLSLFVDVGNVWANFRKMKLSEIRPGAGIGLHYLTPVGPILLEYGWKLDKKTGERPGELNLSIGYPF